MPEKHGNGKETDITAVLVVALVLMVGALIAKTAGDFTKQSTSTDSRAAKPNGKAIIGKQTGGQAAPQAAVLSDWDYCVDKAKGNTHFIPGNLPGTSTPEMTVYAKMNACNSSTGEISIYTAYARYRGITQSATEISCCLNPSGYNRREKMLCNPSGLTYSGGNVQMVGEAECLDACSATKNANGEYYLNIKDVLTATSNIGINKSCKIARLANDIKSGYCCMKVKDK